MTFSARSSTGSEQESSIPKVEGSSPSVLTTYSNKDTKTMAEHTPTPWMMQKCGELCPDDVMIVADMGIHNGIQHISTVAKALSIRQPADVTAANAAFIVMACNSHEALVKALDAAIHVINITRSPGSYTAENVLEDAERTFDEAVDALRALALSEQEGGGRE